MAEYDIEAAKKAFSAKPKGLGMGTFIGSRNSQDPIGSISDRGSRTDIVGGKEIGQSGYVVGGRLSNDTVSRANAYIRANRAGTVPATFNSTTNPQPKPTNPTLVKNVPVNNIPETGNVVTNPQESVQQQQQSRFINGPQPQQVTPEGLAATNKPLYDNPVLQTAPNPFVGNVPSRRNKRGFLDKFILQNQARGIDGYRDDVNYSGDYLKNLTTGYSLPGL